MLVVIWGWTVQLMVWLRRSLHPDPVPKGTCEWESLTPTSVPNIESRIQNLHDGRRGLRAAPSCSFRENAQHLCPHPHPMEASKPIIFHDVAEALERYVEVK
jgi:hypothetical protein